MNKRLRFALFFAAGFVVGAIVAGGFVAWRWYQSFENAYALDVADQANVAREIYRGRADDLAGSITRSLPEYVRALDTSFRDAQAFNMAIWLVADAYKAAGQEPPADVQRILESAPPRPDGWCPTPPATGHGESAEGAQE